MIIVISLLVVAIAVVLLSIGIILKKDGKFPNTHIEDSEAMRQRGIRCANKELSEAAFRPNLTDLIEKNK